MNDEEIEEIINHRHWDLEHNFTWTPEKKAKAVKFCKYIYDLQNEMYDKVVSLRDQLEELKKKQLFKSKYYLITAFIYYANITPLVFMDTDLAYAINKKNYFDQKEIYCKNGDIKNRVDIFHRRHNWNIEAFDKKDFKTDIIPYFVHDTFINSHAYTRSDMMVMNHSDFKYDIRISFTDEP